MGKYDERSKINRSHSKLLVVMVFPWNGNFHLCARHKLYGRWLTRCVGPPAIEGNATMERHKLVLDVRDLRTFVVGRYYSIVRGVSFSARQGETLAIVGESGCGKTVTLHSVMRLLPKNGRLIGGKVLFYDQR